MRNAGDSLAGHALAESLLSGSAIARILTPFGVCVFLALLVSTVQPAASAGESTVSQGASLVRNGGFEQTDGGDASRPAGWDKPDGLGVQWTNSVPGDGHGKAIRMDTRVTEQQMVAQWKKIGLTQWDIPKPADNAIAATYGLSYYSETIPVRSGQVYRVTFDFKGPSGGAKVWVRGYGMLQGEMRRRYETIVNCRVSSGEWTAFSQEFHPTKFRPEVTEMKVMLYAYWPPGVYWFDNVRIEPVASGEKSP